MSDRYSVGGSIPCCGCGNNIHIGIVHKIANEVFVCDICFIHSFKLIVDSGNGLEQFEENHDK